MRRTSLGAKKVGVSRYEVARQNAQYLWNLFSCENRFSKYQSFSKPLCFPFPQRRLRNPSRETAKTQRRRKGQNTKAKKGPKHKGEERAKTQRRRKGPSDDEGKPDVRGPRLRSGVPATPGGQAVPQVPRGHVVVQVRRGGRGETEEEGRASFDPGQRFRGL